MIFGRIRCGKCGQWGHNAEKCKFVGAPLETPSHNGPYRGKAKVRVIPAGVFGEDLKSDRALKAKKGHRVQSRLALANKQPRNPQGKFV